MSSPDGEITRLLRQWQEGDGASLDALLPEVWQELRRIAAHELRANAGHETLQPPALVNDLFVRLLGYDFLNASASAKLVNTATNLAALILFAAKGHVWWHFMVAMALANVAGSLLGTRLALKHGAGFVRGVFIVVVSALILKTGYDAFLR